MRIYLFTVTLFLSCSSFAQDFALKTDTLSGVIDNKYREDNIYIALNYDLLDQMPEGMSQNGFSLGLSLGYIRDIPLNEKRNFGIGLGLGFSTNSINQNLKITKENSTILYEIINSDEFSKNKFSTQIIELPFELRWRTSTPTEYKFWRIYAGFKLGYIVSANSKFKGNGERIVVSNLRDDMNLWQYGLTLSAGYSTWNVNLYYGLNPIFNKNALVNGVKNDAKLIKIGLIFYLL